MLLYRPVGLAELSLVYRADMRAFPPRLPDQPIFYPVLDQPYASQIAREWNTTTPPFAGFVTRFRVADEVAGRHEPQVVGSRQHRELWVPAAELSVFNEAIEGHIEVVEAWFGDRFEGEVAGAGALAGLSAREQPAALCRLLAAGPAAFEQAVADNHVAIHANHAWWVGRDLSPFGVADGERDALLGALSRSFAAAKRPPLFGIA